MCSRGGLADHNTLDQLTNQSPSRISKGRGFIKPGNNRGVYQRMDREVWNKGKLCENNAF